MNTNEPKFTKGEWRTLLDAQGECMVMHPTKEGHAIALLTATHRAMFGIYPDWEDAKLIKETGRTWKSLRDERKANCLLIASAPSLYTALELALKREENRLSAVDGTNFDEQTLAELDDARNAIAIYSAALDRAGSPFYARLFNPPNHRKKKMKIFNHPKFDPEFPEKFNWELADSHKLTPIAKQCAFGITIEAALENPGNRKLTPGLRAALQFIAESTDTI